MKNQNEYEFKYKGNNFIDLNTLITSQFHFLATVNELQKQLYPEAKINIKVSAFEEGSFAVQMLFETSWLQSIFNTDNLPIVNEVIKALSAIIGVHKYLNGSKADIVEEKGDSVEIKCEGNNNTFIVKKTVFNIYKDNSTLQRTIQQNFELLSEDKEIEGVEINDKSNKEAPENLLNVDQEDFEVLRSENPYANKETNEEIVLNQTIYIKKPNLFPEKNRVWKWEMLFKGNDISAKMLDKNLEHKINDGLKIGQGDRFIADIKIYYKFDERFNTFITTNRYDILKVHKLIGRETQNKLNL